MFVHVYANSFMIYLLYVFLMIDVNTPLAGNHQIVDRASGWFLNKVSPAYLPTLQKLRCDCLRKNLQRLCFTSGCHPCMGHRRSVIAIISLKSLHYMVSDNFCNNVYITIL